MGLSAADREPVLAVVGFGPPAIENRQVQSAVQDHLLAAGPARFERPAGCVGPDVDTVYESSADIDVVVLKEENLPAEQRIARQAGNSLKQLFAGVIFRVSLAGEDEL